MLKRLSVEFVPHDSQRYDTVGDWQLWFGGEELHLRISELGDWRSNFLVAIHELIEAVQCVHNGVSQEQVDAFDTGLGKDLDEPGESEDAPYHLEHMIADGVERILCTQLGMTWSEHTRNVDGASEEKA